MPSLADIVALTETVTLRGVDYRVVGIDLQQIGQLTKRFPELEQIIENGGLRGLGVDALLKLSSGLINAIIACGLGEYGAEVAEAGAGNLALGEKAEVLGTLMDLSLPGGSGPLADLAARIIALNKAAAGERVTEGTGGFRVKVRSKPSPLPPTNSPDPATDAPPSSP